LALAVLEIQLPTQQVVAEQIQFLALLQPQVEAVAVRLTLLVKMVLLVALAVVLEVVVIMFKLLAVKVLLDKEMLVEKTFLVAAVTPMAVAVAAQELLE
jgi:hypothetical protein